MSTADPLVGSTVVGRYRIEERLGGGGMGAVYRATQEPLGRAVALKVIKRSLTDDPVAVARFEKEARAMATLHDPTIVTIHDFGTLDGSALGATGGAGLFIAMELLDGEDLGECLSRTPRLDWRLVAYIGARVCDALAVAHHARVIHRDLKPANIMLLGEKVSEKVRPRVKVVDFGVAKLGQDAGGGLTNTGMVVGTPGYIAPEQMSGVTDDPRSDLYALGVILFESLAGRAPFDAETPIKVLLKHMVEPAPPLASLLPQPTDVPTALHELVDQLLLKDPAQRPETAGDVGARLTAMLEHGRTEGARTNHALFTPLDAATPTEGAGLETPKASPIASTAHETPAEFFTSTPERGGLSLNPRAPAGPESARVSPAASQSTAVSTANDTPATGAQKMVHKHPLATPRARTVRNAFVVVFAALGLSMASCTVGAVFKLRKSEIVMDGSTIHIRFASGRRLVVGNGGVRLLESDDRVSAEFIPDPPPEKPAAPPENEAQVGARTQKKAHASVVKSKEAVHAPIGRAPPPIPSGISAPSELSADVLQRLHKDAQERGLITVATRPVNRHDENAMRVFTASLEPFVDELGKDRAERVLETWRADIARQVQKGALTAAQAQAQEERLLLGLETIRRIDK